MLLEEAELKTLVAPDYKLNSELAAASFQDALNALYPPGAFDVKHIQFYEKEGGVWYFIRGESFSLKKKVLWLVLMRLDQLKKN